jgi:hypothetical protein
VPRSTRDGWAVVENVMSADCGRRRARRPHRDPRVDPVRPRRLRGPQDPAVYALFAKTRTFDAPATHPLVLGALDRVLGHYQLSAPTGIEIGPGENARSRCTPTTRSIHSRARTTRSS